MASIYYGDNGSTAALMYEPISRDLGDWLYESGRDVLSRVSERAKSFFSRASRYRERTGFDQAMAMREQVHRATRHVLDDDDFRYLDDLLGIQLAKPKMRRYLMADPTLRQMYREKRLSGWDNTIDDDLSVPVNETPEYLHVTNNVLIGDKFTTTSNDLLDLYEEKESLTLTDKTEIMLTWDRAKAIIQLDKLAPTSPHGATLD